MKLMHLSDGELLTETKNSVLRERDAILIVLHHLREVDRRMLYAAKFTTLFNYCTEELGYDAASAQLRISSMRLLRELPECEAKIEKGELNLTLMSQAQTFFRKEKITEPERKREILATITGQTTREAQQILLNQTETPELHQPDKIRAVSETHSEVKFLADTGLLEDLETLKALLAHSHSGLKEIFKVAVKDAIQKRSLRAQNEMRRQIRARDQSQCTYIHEGKRCQSRYALEYDHIVPKSLGGNDSLENLRLLCRKHNQWAAVKAFRLNKMSGYLPALRAQPLIFAFGKRETGP